MKIICNFGIWKIRLFKKYHRTNFFFKLQNGWIIQNGADHYNFLFWTTTFVFFNRCCSRSLIQHFTVKKGYFKVNPECQPLWYSLVCSICQTSVMCWCFQFVVEFWLLAKTDTFHWWCANSCLSRYLSGLSCISHRVLMCFTRVFCMHNQQ
jgi:hypothetical protein